MEQDLKNLIASDEFRQYRRAHQTPRFNLFDVLRNAEFEIRHSNVLAWLLDPAGTHQTGSMFLQRFIQCLNDNADGAERIPEPSSYSADNVRVKRELHYVDITIFFEAEKLLIAVENKTEGISPEHGKQVLGYERETLRKEYENYDIRSVLLTTSREGDSSEHRFVHVSWHGIHAIVEALLARGDVENEIRTFLRHYLAIVKKLITQSGLERNYFTKLVKSHKPILKRLLEEMTQEQEEQSLLNDVPHDHRATMEQLVKDFGREPRRLMTSIRSFLNATRKIEARPAPNKYGTAFWLHWRMDDVAKALGIEWRLKWELESSYRKVSVSLYFDLDRKTRPVIKRIENFMKDKLIAMKDQLIAKDKLIWEWHSNYVYVYRHLLMDEEMLSRPFEDVDQTVREKLKEFLDSDYRTIQDYFKCLAFDPRAAVPGDPERTTDPTDQ